MTPEIKVNEFTDPLGDLDGICLEKEIVEADQVEIQETETKEENHVAKKPHKKSYHTEEHLEVGEISNVSPATPIISHINRKEVVPQMEHIQQDSLQQSHVNITVDEHPHESKSRKSSHNTEFLSKNTSSEKLDSREMQFSTNFIYESLYYSYLKLKLGYLFIDRHPKLCK